MTRLAMAENVSYNASGVAHAKESASILQAYDFTELHGSILICHRGGQPGSVSITHIIDPRQWPSRMHNPLGQVLRCMTHVLDGLSPLDGKVAPLVPSKYSFLFDQQKVRNLNHQKKKVKK